MKRELVILSLLVASASACGGGRDAGYWREQVLSFSAAPYGDPEQFRLDIDDGESTCATLPPETTLSVGGEESQELDIGGASSAYAFFPTCYEPFAEGTVSTAASSQSPLRVELDLGGEVLGFEVDAPMVGPSLVLKTEGPIHPGDNVTIGLDATVASYAYETYGGDVSPDPTFTRIDPDFTFTDVDPWPMQMDGVDMVFTVPSDVMPGTFEVSPGASFVRLEPIECSFAECQVVTPLLVQRIEIEVVQ